MRPDGRHLAMYSRHNTDGYSRWRIADENGWSPEHTFDHGTPTTYSNVYPSAPPGTGRLYGFVRTLGRDPHILVSDDNGSTWSDGGRLLDGPGRPYVRYAIDGAGAIHLITTEQHPDEYATSVYHGVIVDGRLLRSDGSVVDDDLSDHSAASPDQLTAVFTGDADNRAWTVDLHVDEHALPYAVFSVRSPGAQHRYHYARFDGARWRVAFLAHAGGELYRGEPSYTGLAALDPHDPERAFISTNVHPATGDALVSTTDDRRHHEIYEGVTTDRGANWTWTAITANSTVDNLRPIVPIWNDRDIALLWLRGTYTTYHDYDLDVVGIISDRSTRHRRPTPTPAQRWPSARAGHVTSTSARPARRQRRPNGMCFSAPTVWGSSAGVRRVNSVRGVARCDGRLGLPCRGGR